MNSVSSIVMRNLSKTLVGSVIAGLSLSACTGKDEAIAQTPSESPQETDFIEANTQADCLTLGLDTEAKIMRCMKAVSDRESEDRQVEIEALNDELDKEKELGAELETTVDGLSKVVAIQEGEEDTPEK